MRSWPFALILLSPAANAEDGPSRDDIMALAGDKNINLKMDKLVSAIDESTFDWTYEDVYALVDLELPEDTLKPAAAKAGMFWDSPQPLAKLRVDGRAGARPQTVKIGANSDFVILFETFNDVKNGIDGELKRIGDLGPRQGHETDDAWFLRQRKHEAAVISAVSPFEGKVDATTFEIELTGTFTAHDGSCTTALISVDLDRVDFGLYRYTLGGKQVDMTLPLTGKNVGAVQFLASGGRHFQATSTPICVSAAAATNLAAAGSKVKITMRRPYDSDAWTGTAEFVNAKTGARL